MTPDRVSCTVCSDSLTLCQRITSSHPTRWHLTRQRVCNVCLMTLHSASGTMPQDGSHSLTLTDIAEPPLLYSAAFLIILISVQSTIPVCSRLEFTWIFIIFPAASIRSSLSERLSVWLSWVLQFIVRPPLDNLLSSYVGIIVLIQHWSSFTSTDFLVFFFSSSSYKAEPLSVAKSAHQKLPFKLNLKA